MQIHGMNSPYGLEHHGLEKVSQAFWNLEPAKLIEEVIRRSEGEFSDVGELYVYTGKQTGRCPEAKYLVENNIVKDQPIWWDANKRMSPATFTHLKERFSSYLESKDVFIQDLLVCADKTYQYSLRVITESAWSALFATNLFIRPGSKQKNNITPDITVIHCPNFHPSPETDGTDTDIVIALDLESKLILIGGTGYAGEIKKSVFTMLNFHLPLQKVFPMHCSANEDVNGNTALFFGLSGTGKTTLSNDKSYKLIGDDEHGWSENGVFNFEGGCYAKTIRLSKKNEPNIWKATRRFGTVLENVSYNHDTRVPDFDSSKFTENTRAAYSLDGLNFIKKSKKGNAPKNIFFLSADAFGVLPPLSLLTMEQVHFYFLLGYTSKLAGTEVGLGIEPKATFSACFAAPFLPLKPAIYTKMLMEKIAEHGTKVWLVNTGWTEGPYGIGHRIPIPYTRALIRAALSGKLKKSKFIPDPIFGLPVPEHCEGVPDELIYPRKSWKDANYYDKKAMELFINFRNVYAQRTDI
jgi:phosphoenolpyruvate carboxykinase (ATP)